MVDSIIDIVLKLKNMIPTLVLIFVCVILVLTVLKVILDCIRFKLYLDRKKERISNGE